MASADAMIRQIENLGQQVNIQVKKIEEARRQKEDVERRILQEQPIHAKARKAHDEAAERLKQVQAERKHLEGTLARMLKGNDDLKVQIGEQKLSDEHLKDIKRMEKEAFVRESIEIGQQIQAACNKVKA